MAGNVQGSNQRNRNERAYFQIIPQVMKDTHKGGNLNETTGELLEKAKDLETAGKLNEAGDIYQKLIKKNPTKEYAYDRLMIIYRKNAEFKKEKEVIDAGIKAFEQFYKTASRVPAKKKVTSLSQQLLKATGLADKKGNLIFEREPLGRWKKRRKTVEKKLRG